MLRHPRTQNFKSQGSLCTYSVCYFVGFSFEICLHWSVSFTLAFASFEVCP